MRRGERNILVKWHHHISSARDMKAWRTVRNDCFVPLLYQFL
ncbi:hypothetical protein DsansV1_C37g0232651 [Dioscorea sansibarensis]